MCIISKLQTESDMPSGAIIIWMVDGTCPSGYTRLNAVDGKYISANSAYTTNAGTGHTHTASASHTHNNPSGNTGNATKSILVYAAGGASAYNQYHPLGSGGTTTAATPDTSSTAAPGLNKVDVVLCKKD